MDVEFWIYIIVGVIYFLSRLLKKGDEVSSETPPPVRSERPKTMSRPEAQATEEAQRPLTFEELLREITEGKQVQRRETQPETFQRPRDTEEAQSLEEVGGDEAERAPRWKPYEEIPVAAERKSLEETLRLEDTLVEFRKFDAFEQREQKKVSEEYIKMLRNPGTLKQAVVISEILKRKF